MMVVQFLGFSPNLVGCLRNRCDENRADELGNQFSGMQAHAPAGQDGLAW